jgi:hypothetical protein
MAINVIRTGRRGVLGRAKEAVRRASKHPRQKSIQISGLHRRILKIGSCAHAGAADPPRSRAIWLTGMLMSFSSTSETDDVAPTLAASRGAGRKVGVNSGPAARLLLNCCGGGFCC